MAERPTVAVLVPNPFLLVAVETAVGSAGAVVERHDSAVAAAASRGRVIVADLAALGPEPEAAVRLLVGQGKSVLAFTKEPESESIAAIRRTGAVVLPRAAFLARLPELLRLALQQ